MLGAIGQKGETVVCHWAPLLATSARAPGQVGGGPVMATAAWGTALRVAVKTTVLAGQYECSVLPAAQILMLARQTFPLRKIMLTGQK